MNLDCQHVFSHLVVTRIRDWELGVPGEFAYQECEHCRLLRLHPFPRLQDLISFYPDSYPAFLIGSKAKGLVYRALYKLKSFFFMKKMARDIQLKNAKVLDVGCGSGEMLELFRTWGASEVVGIDFSPRACEIAKTKGIETFCGTFADFKKSQFDIVLMHHYIEHTLEPEKEIKKAYESLAPQGALIMELPNFNSLDQKLFGRFWGGNHVPRHTFQFRAEVLLQMIRNQGFSIVELTHEINPAHFALSVQNLIQYLKLKDSPQLVTGGRKWYFSFLLLALVPIQIAMKFSKCSGMISVIAKK